MTVEDYLEENARRNSVREEVYDPLRGVGSCGARFVYRQLLLPETMRKDADWETATRTEALLERLRLHHDFEYWCARCVKIRDKQTGRVIPFVLNPPQRKVAAELERQRSQDRPIRIIILKARQWGGSTLVQVYMAWIQMVHTRNWNSVICAHVKDTAATIRGMYSLLLDEYPRELWEGDEGVEPAFKSFERSQNIRQIAGRGCRVSIGSSENQEASRGSDYAMAHLSEVAFWKDSKLHSPAELVRAICSGIALVPLSFIAMESTANGVGTYFHREWLRAERGESDKSAVFVAWYEIPGYRLALPRDPRRFIESLDEYERGLWERGLTLEQIWWHRNKRLEAGTLWRMMAEYPTTPTEAFASTGDGVFPMEQVVRLQEGCREASWRGEMNSRGEFVEDTYGGLEVWEKPAVGGRYIVTVDVGGRSQTSDWSVVAVMRHDGENPEVVAQWRGHTDHDLLARHAERVARWYNMALLVIESNTLETESYDSPAIVLERLSESYPRLYRRDGLKPGFHTNVATKGAAIAALTEAVRECGYVERSAVACAELTTYERKANGSCGARRGCHDDVVMTRAIGLFVLSSRVYRTESSPRPGELRGWW